MSKPNPQDPSRPDPADLSRVFGGDGASLLADARACASTVKRSLMARQWRQCGEDVKALWRKRSQARGW
jgi:hypothetical protein